LGELYNIPHNLLMHQFPRMLLGVYFFNSMNIQRCQPTSFSVDSNEMKNVKFA